MKHLNPLLCPGNGSIKVFGYGLSMVDSSRHGSQLLQVILHLGGEIDEDSIYVSSAIGSTRGRCGEEKERTQAQLYLGYNGSNVLSARIKRSYTHPETLLQI